MCGTVRIRPVHSGNLAPMDDLSESELDQLWELVRGHAPGTREELRDTLRGMADVEAVTVNVTPDHVEVKLPLTVAAFDRKRNQ